ncbi:MAG: IS3 family transposase [Thermodesulfobacteriota bacterium]
MIQYLYYYNHERPHQGINGDTPIDFRNKLLPN